MVDQNDNEALIAAARRAISESPEVGRYYLIVASSQLVAERYEEAEATLQSGLAIQKIGSDPLMRSEFYTLFGDIAFDRTEPKRHLPIMTRRWKIIRRTTVR